MENLMISANAVLPMCLVMALGYGTRRLGWIRREEISAINKIAFRIFLPCLLYYNVYCSDLSGSFDPLLMAYAVGGVLLTFRPRARLHAADRKAAGAPQRDDPGHVPQQLRHHGHPRGDGAARRR